MSSRLSSPQASFDTPGVESSTIALLDVDEELARVIEPGDQRQARRVLVAPAAVIQPGPVELDRLSRPASTFAALVTDGELTCDVTFDGRSLTEMVGAGDVLSLWEPNIDGVAVTRQVFAVSTTRLALLDRRFLLAAAHWPALMLTIHRRLADQEHRRAVHGAICQLSRVEDRLIAMLSLLGARTGRVSPEGLIVPFPATHETLGRMVGARRPTVSLALKELELAGRLNRRPNDEWLLSNA